jgi:signal transduction histidine kinase
MSVRDYGCGIPKDKIKNLFLDFGTLDEQRERNP